MTRSARRSLLLLVSLALAAAPAAFAVPGPDIPAPLPPACSGVLCAGSATADITPPITSPQFAYTFRHCAVNDPVDVVTHTTGFDGSPPAYPEHIEEGIAWTLNGGTPCASNKLAPDTDAYAKTFPPSEGTYGRLQSNAFVLVGRNGVRAAVAQVDLGGLPGEVHEAVAKRIVGETGIDREHLLISATHTHGSAGGIFQYQGYALLGGDEFDPRIYEAVVGGITTSILEAWSRLRPAKLAAGEGSILDANHNRSNDAWLLNPETQELNGEIKPPNDAPRLLVIRVDTTDGIPLGVITNYANHGVIHGTFNLYLGGDNQGATTRSVSRAIRAEPLGAGVSFPADWEVVDALTNGATGDITPDSDRGGFSYSQYGRSEIPFEEFARMENAGMRQTPEALNVWRSLGDELSADVDIDARFDWVCFCGQEVPDDEYDPYDRGDWEPAHETDPAYRSTSVQAILGSDNGTAFPRTVFPAHHKEAPRLIGSQTNPSITRIQLLRIGRTALASMPGEPTIQMGRRIERSVKAALGSLVDRVVTIGLANDYDSYMATIQEYEAYQYEGGFSLFGQQTGNLLKWRLVRLAQWMRDGLPVPACTRERGCIEHPDTTFLAASPEPLSPDVRVGEVLEQPPSPPDVLERFQGTRFSWLGGGPGAEWSPDDPLVEVQREVSPGVWSTVASDLDTEVPVHYDKWAGAHRWDAYFDAPKDAVLGTYRFRVTGHAGGGPGVRTTYELTSQSFLVGDSTALSIGSTGGGSYRVQNPAPNAAWNYRYRTLVASTATVTGTLTRSGGSPEPFSAGSTFTLAAGDVLTVAPGGILDSWGNTNAAAFTLTG